MSLVLEQQQQRTITTWLPIYYGWVNVIVAAFVMTATFPGRTHGMGFMTKPLLRELDMSAQLYSWLNFTAVTLGALACIPLGRLIDLYGSRLVLPVTTLVFGLSVLGTGAVGSIPSLFVLLLLTRVSTQSGMTPGTEALVGKWFQRRVGLASALYLLLTGVLFTGVTLLVGKLVQEVGWRPVWYTMGGIITLVVAPLTWFAARSTPADCGLAIDPEPARPPGPVLVDLPLSAALRSPVFWVYTAAYGIFALAYTATTLFNQALLEERGFDLDTYTLIVTVLPIAGMVTKLLAGWASLRCGQAVFLTVGTLLLALAMGGFPLVTNHIHVVLFAIVFGAAGSCIMLTHSAIYTQAFGPAHLGRIMGAAQVVAVIVSASGPAFLTGCKAWFGSYAVMYYGVAVVLLPLAVAGWLLPLPRRAAVVPPAPGESHAANAECGRGAGEVSHVAECQRS